MKAGSADLDPRILRVIVSLSLLVFAPFCFLLSHDLFQTSHLHPMGWEERLNYNYWNEFGFLFTAAVFAVPILIWHVSDLLTNRKPITRFETAIASYRTVFIPLVLGLYGFTIIASGVTERLSCLEAHLENTDGDEFMAFCTPTPGYLVEFLVLPFLGMLVLVAALKLCIAIISSIKKSNV